MDNEISEADQIKELEDGPPCLATLVSQGIPEGGRDNTLYQYAVYAKKKWPQNWESKVTLFNVISKSVGLFSDIQSPLAGIGNKQVKTPSVHVPQPPEPKADPGTAHPPLSVSVVEQAPPLVELTQRFPPPEELMVSVLVAVLVILSVLQ